VSGWLLCLLLDRSGAVAFAPPSPGTGIPSWCTIHGYAKAADWFWFAAFPLAGIGGTWISSRLHAAIRRSGRNRWLPDLPVWPAPFAIAGATALLFMRDRAGFPLGLILAVAGTGWPWLSRRWYAPPEAGGGVPETGTQYAWPAGWTLAAVTLGCAWVVDPCVRTRDLDLLHEGVHLLHVQSWLAGDLGAGLVRTMYGPLYTWSMVRWMSAFGMTVLSLRWYFLAAQAAGMVVALLSLRAACSTRTAAAAGAWLLLTAACTGPYGWANILRVTLPLASVVLVSTAATGGGPRRAAAAGVLAALGLLYSPEFALAGVAASAVAILAARRDRRAVAVPWTAAAGATLLVLWTAMHGAGSVRAATALFGNGYPLARLGGDVSYPLPAFRLPPGDGGWEPLLRALSVWGPVLLAGATLAAAARAASASRGDPASAGAPKAGLLASVAVFAALALIPAVARPLGHQAMAAPAWILLATAWLDALLRSRRRLAAVVVASCMGAWGILAPDAGARALLARWTCAPPAGLATAPADWRLGGILVTPGTARFLGRAIPLVRRLCPPDGRIVLAAPSYLGLSFLAGRAGAPPFPLTLRAAPAADRRLMIAELDRLRPPLAVVTLDQLGVILPESNPELWAYVRTRYRPVRTLGDLIFYVREW